MFPPKKSLSHMLSDNSDFMKMITDIKANANVLHREFYFLDWKSRYKLCNAYCIILYGRLQMMKKMGIAWRVSINYLLDLNCSLMLYDRQV